jgi:hypothetical protein
VHAPWYAPHERYQLLLVSIAETYSAGGGVDVLVTATLDEESKAPVRVGQGRLARRGFEQQRALAAERFVVGPTALLAWLDDAANSICA